MSDKLRIAIFTDAYTHVAYDSSFPIVTHMLQDPEVECVYVVDRQDNPEFFENKNSSSGKLLATRLNHGEKWEFQKDRRYADCEIGYGDVNSVMLRMDNNRPMGRLVTQDLLEHIEQTFSHATIGNNPRGIINTGSKLFLPKVKQYLDDNGVSDFMPHVALARTIEDVRQFRQGQIVNAVIRSAASFEQVKNDMLKKLFGGAATQDINMLAVRDHLTGEVERNFPSADLSVMKVEHGSGGQGVIRTRLDPSDSEEATKWCSEREVEDFLQQNGLCLISEFLEPPGGKPQQDNRILVVDGKIIGAFARIAKPGEWHCNLNAGGKFTFAEVTDFERDMVESVWPLLKEQGITMAGFDTLQGSDGRRYLSEINVNNNGGVLQIENVSKDLGIAIPATEIVAKAYLNYFQGLEPGAFFDKVSAPQLQRHFVELVSGRPAERKPPVIMHPHA